METREEMRQAVAEMREEVAELRAFIRRGNWSGTKPVPEPRATAAVRA